MVRLRNSYKSLACHWCSSCHGGSRLAAAELRPAGSTTVAIVAGGGSLPRRRGGLAGERAAPQGKRFVYTRGARPVHQRDRQEQGGKDHARSFSLRLLAEAPVGVPGHARRREPHPGPRTGGRQLVRPAALRGNRLGDLPVEGHGCGACWSPSGGRRGDRAGWTPPCSDLPAQGRAAGELLQKMSSYPPGMSLRPFVLVALGRIGRFPQPPLRCHHRGERIWVGSHVVPAPERVLQ